MLFWSVFPSLSTECYCRLQIVSDIQLKVSIGGQLVWQVWCALKVNTYIPVCPVCCVMCSRNTICVSVRALFMDGISGVAAVCCRHTFHQLLQTDRQTDRHTPRLHTVCSCDSSLLRFATLTTVTSTSYSCVRRDNLPPDITVLPASNTKYDTCQLNTSLF